MNDCEQHFVCSQNVCFSPTLPGGQKPTAFHNQILCGCLSRFWCSVLGSPDWGSPYFSYIPLEIQLLLMSTWPALLCFHTPTSLSVAPLYSLGFEASLQPVFSWSFRMVFLYFSCNSILVLVGGKCSFHLIRHH